MKLLIVFTFVFALIAVAEAGAASEAPQKLDCISQPMGNVAKWNSGELVVTHPSGQTLLSYEELSLLAPEDNGDAMVFAMVPARGAAAVGMIELLKEPTSGGYRTALFVNSMHELFLCE